MSTYEKETIKLLRNPKLINRNYLNGENAEYTSDTDLTDYFGKRFQSKIKKYSDLRKYNSVDSFLKGKVDFCILLVENENNSGHWVCLLKYPLKGRTVIEFFNSYGEKPGYDAKLAMGAGLSHPSDITRLLDIEVEKGREVIYNKRRLQRLKFNVATCGKHCILRCIMLKHFNKDLEKYLEWVKRMCKRLKITPDQLVTLLIEID